MHWRICLVESGKTEPIQKNYAEGSGEKTEGSGGKQVIQAVGHLAIRGYHHVLPPSLLDQTNQALLKPEL